MLQAAWLSHIKCEVINSEAMKKPRRISQALALKMKNINIQYYLQNLSYTPTSNLNPLTEFHTQSLGTTIAGTVMKKPGLIILGDLDSS